MTRPSLLYWLLPSGVVLVSLFGPTECPEYRCRRHVPRGAVAWQERAGQPWRPLAELPKAWGLGPAGGAPAPEEPEP